MLWVCRERVFWRTQMWSPGDTIEIIADHKWFLGGGWWAPEGAEIIDPADNVLVPRQFEPVDLMVLVNPKQVYAARGEEKMPDKLWKLVSELKIEERPTVEAPDPVALDPETLKKPKAKPEAITPSEMRKRLPSRGK